MEGQGSWLLGERFSQGRNALEQWQQTQQPKLRECYPEYASGWLDPLLCLLGERPACIALGQLHSSQVPTEEGGRESLLTPLYLENPEKVHRKLELSLRAHGNFF